VLAAGRPGSGRPGGRHGRRPAPPGPGSRAAAGGPAGTQSALDAARERRGTWPGGRDNGRSAVGCRGPAPPARPFHAPAAAVRQGDRCLPGRGWGRGPCRNDTWTAAGNHGKSGDPAESTHGAPVPQSVSRGIQAGRAATCRIRGSMQYRANHHGHSGAAMGWPFWLGQHGPIPGHQTRARFTRTVRRNRFCRVTGQARGLRHPAGLPGPGLPQFREQAVRIPFDGLGRHADPPTTPAPRSRSDASGRGAPAGPSRPWPGPTAAAGLVLQP
jgi:hypothetical protein